MRIALRILILCCSFLVSCKKDDIILSDGDYLIFGHFYGMCQGEQCIEIFRLESTQLLEDSRDQYPSHSSFYDADFTILLDAKKFDAVKDLTDFIPAQLLNQPNGTIGQPDAGDWGGLYIEYKKDGVRRFWLLDKMESNVPADFHEFINKVEEKIDLLQ